MNSLGKIWLIILLVLLVSNPASSAEVADLETEDSYANYKALYVGIHDQDATVSGSNMVASLLKAYEIFAETEGEIREDYQYFRIDNGNKYQKYFHSPSLLAYIIAVNYRDDPRYDLEYLIEDAKSELEAGNDYFSRSFPLLVLAYRDDGILPLIEMWKESSLDITDRRQFPRIIWSAGDEVQVIHTDDFESYALSSTISGVCQGPFDIVYVD